MSRRIWDSFELEIMPEQNEMRPSRRRKGPRSLPEDHFDDWMDDALRLKGRSARWVDFDPERERRRRKLGRIRRRSDD